MFSSKKSFFHKAALVILIWSAIPFGHSASTGYLDRAERVNGWNTRSVFEPLYEKHRASVVEILEDGHQIALGTVVSEDGFIVTKASEFGMALEVRDANHQVYVPEFISVDPENDLALLKIKADGMKPVQWSDDASPSMGQWVISPHEDETQVRVGVISAIQRAIPKKHVALGVVLFTRRNPEEEASQRGVMITEIVAGGAAEKAGLQSRDIILAIEEISTDRSQEVIDAIREFWPGDTIEITIKRGEEVLKREATLEFYDDIFAEADANLELSGDISKRRTGFSRIIQHDIPIPPKAMGGFLMTVEGKVIGLNIARHDRVATYALPAALVQASIEKLK